MLVAVIASGQPMQLCKSSYLTTCFKLWEGATLTSASQHPHVHYNLQILAGSLQEAHTMAPRFVQGQWRVTDYACPPTSIQLVLPVQGPYPLRRDFKRGMGLLSLRQVSNVTLVPWRTRWPGKQL